MDSFTLQFRKAYLTDIGQLVKFRIAFLKEQNKLGPEANPEEIINLEKALTEYFEQTLKSGQFIGFIAELNNEIVSLAGMIITEYPPAPGQLKKLQGYLINVYTVPAYRKKNICSNLLKYLINEAKKSGLTRLCLHATELAENVYRRLGFQEPAMKAMQLELI